MKLEIISNLDFLKEIMHGHGLPSGNWGQEYNQFRPHSSLNYRPPAPETIEPKVKTLTLKVV